MSSNENTTKNSSEWNITTDIYQIVQEVDKLKSKYIEKKTGETEDETTLALGIFGFLGDTEAKKIQTATIMAGELGNEMFPTRAKLDKNVLTHAIYENIENINAIPAILSISLGVKEKDINPGLYMLSNDLSSYPDRTEDFIFKKETPIFIGDYEFHLDYDIHLFGIKSNKTHTIEFTDSVTGVTSKYTVPYYMYTARYDMDEVNYLSDVSIPYLGQPYTQNFNNQIYIFFEARVRQVHMETIEDTMVTDSIIDNRSYNFDFSDQMANFDVYVTDNGVTTRLRPYFYGSAIDPNIDKYCWYLYINNSSIRVGFDPNSYVPGLNSDIKIVTYTTLGANGNFTYDDTNENSVYVPFTDENNNTVTVFVRCETDSTDGKNIKSTDELKKLIPKMALSRGYITTETDLNNYFNLISSDDNRLKLQKKVDNQLERIWYGYFVLKDQVNNIIPTNTIKLKVDPTDDRNVITDDNIETNTRYIVKAGSKFRYSTARNYGQLYDAAPVPFSRTYFDEKSDYFYYRLPYNIIINSNPLYAAYYMTIVDQDSYFEYNYVNIDCGIGFTTMRNNFKRSLLKDTNTYKFSFYIDQSINDDFGLMTEDSTTDTINIKCFLVIHQDGVPYRYIPCDLDSVDIDTTYRSYWSVSLKTDDVMDTNNRIKILNMYEAGFNSMNYGFFDGNVEAYLYICANFTDTNGNSHAYIDEDAGLDIIPGLQDKKTETGWTLVNIYKIHDGLTFFNNFTQVMNTRVVKNLSSDGKSFNFDIYGVPVVGEHYFYSELTGNKRSVEDADKAVAYFMKELTAKKAYIDHCLEVLENSMMIDFKYFNTYGPSKTYKIGDTNKYLDHVDLTLNFRVKLKNASDTATKDSIINYIKDYIEDINDIGDLDFSNLIHDLKEEYSDTVKYIDFRYFNGQDNIKWYDSDDMGSAHLVLEDPEDPHVVPEFINVRNQFNEGETALIPCITVEIIK